MIIVVKGIMLRKTVVHERRADVFLRSAGQAFRPPTRKDGNDSKASGERRLEVAAAVDPLQSLRL